MPQTASPTPSISPASAFYASTDTLRVVEGNSDRSSLFSDRPTQSALMSKNGQFFFQVTGSSGGENGLMALYMRGMFPESAFWTQSGQVLIMVLLGGMHVFIGPLVGAATLYMLEVFIGQYTQYWQLVLGLILLVIVLVSPEGVAGLLGRLAMRGKRGDDSRA